MKSTKILSADDVVTHTKVGQKYDIVQKYDNIRFYQFNHYLTEICNSGMFSTETITQ